MRIGCRNNSNITTPSVLLTLWCLVCLSRAGAAEEYIWTDRSRGLTDLDIKSIAVNPRDPAGVLCTSDSTVFLSSDSGSTWKSVYRLKGKKARIRFIPDAKAPEMEIRIDTDDYDPEDLRRDGILQDDETLDEIDDSELARRLMDAGILESEPTVGQPEEQIEKSGWHHRSSRIIWHPQNPDTAFLSTNLGLHRSTDGGRTWEYLRCNLTGESQQINAAVITTSGRWIILATQAGLFRSLETDLRFSPVPGIRETRPYLDVTADPYSQDVYAAVSDNKLFVGEPSGRVARFAIPAKQSGYALISVDVMEGESIFAASPTTLYFHQSPDEWKSLASMDLMGAEIRDIHACGNIYLATSRGVYEFDISTGVGRFRNNGLPEMDIRQVTGVSGSDCRLMAATGTGVYIYHAVPIPKRGEPIGMHFERQMDRIPDLNEVTAAALAYSEMNIPRDRQWIRKCRLSPWLPEVHLAFDSNLNSSDNDRRYPSFIVLPDGEVAHDPDGWKWDETDNRDCGVELSVKWFPRFFKMRDDVWAAHDRFHHEIKRRADMIARVRRLYLEYLDADRRIHSLPDGTDKIMQYLYINRLIADLDGLTGSYFSNHMVDH
ncbi:hypothetical protein JXA40_06520 [bacterium]|nr:hypothetical protein [candidate division CSSED10-310 bacterium]